MQTNDYPKLCQTCNLPVLVCDCPKVMLAAFNTDGSRQAELIRRTVTNPISRESFGPFAWEVWAENDPDNVKRFPDREKALAAFMALTTPNPA